MKELLISLIEKINAILQPIKKVLDFNESGKGMAIGKVSEIDGLEIDWDTQFNGGIMLGELFTETDNDGSVFNAYLDRLLESMPNGSIRNIHFTDYPYFTGMSYHGILFKHANSYASLLAHNYQEIIYKRKFNSSWQNWEVVHGISYEVPNKTDITISGNRVQLLGGGYRIINNKCNVQMQLKATATLGANDYWTLLSGLPTAKDYSGYSIMPLCVAKRMGTGTINAYVAGGSLVIVNGAQPFAEGEVISVSGEYVIQ